jgi:hypothetical protein
VRLGRTSYSPKVRTSTASIVRRHAGPLDSPALVREAPEPIGRETCFRVEAVEGRGSDEGSLACPPVVTPRGPIRTGRSRT